MKFCNWLCLELWSDLTKKFTVFLIFHPNAMTSHATISSMSSKYFFSFEFLFWKQKNHFRKWFSVFSCFWPLALFVKVLWLKKPQTDPFWSNSITNHFALIANNSSMMNSIRRLLNWQTQVKLFYFNLLESDAHLKQIICVVLSILSYKRFKKNRKVLSMFVLTKLICYAAF